MISTYEYLISETEQAWYKKYYNSAISFYRRALEQKQHDSITKKAILENIEEIKSKLNVKDKA